MIVGGKLFDDDGQLQAVTGDVSGTRLNGWSVGSSGTPYVENLESDPVSDAVFINGLAFKSDGTLYVTTDAPSDARFISGMAVREDGALHVSTGAVESGDTVIAGWAVSEDGAGRIAID